MGRVRVWHHEGEVSPNTWADFEWIRQHRKELLEQYGECMLLVFNQQVTGTGQSLEEAEANAERNAPPEPPEITPVLYLLAHRHPFLRARVARD
jgi:hypothetical protein